MAKALVLIPARFQSSRFPGKPLAMISGKSMIQRVYENCLSSGAEVWVVTDSSEIEKHVHEFLGQVCRVDDDVPSGSLRISLAYERFFKKSGDQRLIVNVQGDEPLLSGGEIKNLYEFHLSAKFDIGTFVKKRQGMVENFNDPNIVKVIYSEKTKQCHYFSRSPIPYSHDNGHVPHVWYQHIGIYSYTPGSLLAFANLSPSFHEECERLEQLRILESELTIGAEKTDLNLIGVDAPGDILKIEGVLGGPI